MPPALEIQQSASVLTVFLQGLVSFLSPCVLPLLPMYVGYLAGGTQPVAQQHPDDAHDPRQCAHAAGPGAARSRRIRTSIRSTSSRRVSTSS